MRAHSQCAKPMKQAGPDNTPMSIGLLSDAARARVTIIETNSPDDAFICLFCAETINNKLASNQVSGSDAASAATASGSGSATNTSLGAPLLVGDNTNTSAIVANEGTTSPTIENPGTGSSTSIPAGPPATEADSANGSATTEHLRGADNYGMSVDQYQEFKRLFYAKYDARQEQLKFPSKVLSQEEYDHALAVISNWEANKKRSTEEKAIGRKYSHQVASHNSSLVDKKSNRKIVLKNDLFDIINRCHSFQLKHGKDPRPVHGAIKQDYYGITEEDIKTFISLCPICTASRNKISAKMQPLKMILSSTVGKRAQMDLIDMTSSPDHINGYKWILRLIDHHSGYGQVRPLKNKTADECSVKIIEILCSMPVFDIIQSDNGGEFLGNTIRLINE